MRFRNYICIGMFLVLFGMTAVAQDNSTPQTPDTGAPQTPDTGNPPTNTTPAPAFGQTGQPPQQNVDNPPISGLDLPNLDPNASTRSFLVPGIHVSQAVDTNIGSQVGGSAVQGVTRALGSLALQKLWNRYDVGLQYVGGGAYYNNHSFGLTQFHSVDAEQRYLWRTGQFAMRDGFSYLPEGAFGFGAYGGSGALSGVGGLGGGGITGVGLGGGGALLGGGGQVASLGQAPRISNTAVADITQSLSPRSSVTLAGSFGLTHFTDKNATQIVNGQVITFVDSQQVSGQAGYNYQISRADQIGLLYGYQSFHFPTEVAGNFRTHLFHILYGHRISGRMDLVLGGGPQITEISSNATGQSSSISASGRAMLRYRFPQTSVTASYDHYNSTGSGFYGGAKTDLARLDANRPFGRNWTVTADTGYTHNVRIIPFTAGTVPGLSFGYAYVGGSARRRFGRDFSGFVSYQWNNLRFDSTFCTTAPSCNHVSNRQVALIGFDWTPHPIRLD
jgi:hypothetical protein